LESSSKTVSLVNLMRSLLLAHSADLAGAASPLSGMVKMYVLMSIVHLALLAEADLSSAKGRPPVLIRQSPYCKHVTQEVNYGKSSRFARGMAEGAP
jgi:hypothetical protein